MGPLFLLTRVMRPSSPRRGRPAEPSLCSTSRITYLTIALVVAWCMITPMLLLNQMQSTLPDRPSFVQTNNGVLSLRDKEKHDRSVVPLRDDALWTLKDATSEDLQGRDWYNKGRLLVNRNLLYLNKAKGRATQP